MLAVSLGLQRLRVDGPPQQTLAWPPVGVGGRRARDVVAPAPPRALDNVPPRQAAREGPDEGLAETVPAALVPVA